MRVASVFVAIFVLACASRHEPEPKTPALADSSVPFSAPLLPPGVDLTGSWRGGTGPEPEVQTIVLHPTCLVIPAVWLIEQEGNALSAWNFPERYNQGIRNRNDPGPRLAPARGTISGLDVFLSDGTDRYVLRYDTTSRHLRGTRNTEPFWAVRQVVQRTHVCPPPP